MASEGGVIRELVARFSLQADEKSVEKADDIIEGLSEKLRHLAEIFAVVELAKFIGEVVNSANEVLELSERIGTTTEALQGFGFAASLSGSSAETMNMGLKFLTKTIAEAAGGSKEAQKSFAELGVSFKNSDGSLRNAGDLLPEIADALQKVDNPAKRAALSISVFSRAGQELAPTLALGSEGINAIREEMQQLGGVFTEEFTEASHAAVIGQKKIGVAFTSLGVAMAQGVLPVVTKLQQAFIAFWKVNGPAIRERLTKVFEAVGAVIEAVGNIVEMLSKGFLGLVSAFEDASLPLKGLVIAAGVLLGLSTGILTPWLLIAAAIALAVEDLYVFATGGESVIGTLADELFSFVTQGGTALHAFAAMVLDLLVTLRDGGFGALWTEVGEMLKTAATYWGEVIDGFVSTIADAFKSMLKETADLFVDTIKGIVSDFLSLWTGALSGAVNGIKKLLGIETEVKVSHEQPQGEGFKEVPSMPWRKTGEELAQAVGAYEQGANNSPLSVAPTAQEQHAAPSSAPVSAADLSQLGSMFGSASPEVRPAVMAAPATVAPQQAASSSSVYAPQTTTQVTVQAAPGMDENALADLMVTKIDERMQEHNEAAFNAVIGAAR